MSDAINDVLDEDEAKDKTVKLTNQTNGQTPNLERKGETSGKIIFFAIDKRTIKKFKKKKLGEHILKQKLHDLLYWMHRYQVGQGHRAKNTLEMAARYTSTGKVQRVKARILSSTRKLIMRLLLLRVEIRTRDHGGLKQPHWSIQTLSGYRIEVEGYWPVSGHGVRTRQDWNLGLG
nr:hypothetical protein [Tanacetum cinerariifolium]